MSDIFVGTEVEPSAFEIALQEIFLAGLQQRVAETGDFNAAVNATLGFKLDDAGNPVPMTEQERFDSLSPAEQQTYNVIQQQADELQKAIAGEETEIQKQRSEDKLEKIKEQQARRGQTIMGSDLSNAQGFSTPAIQSLGEASRNESLTRSAENEQRKLTAADSVFRGTGLLQDLSNQRFANLVNAPARHDVGGGAGLLSSASQNSIFNAQSQAAAQEGIGNILGSLAVDGAGLLLNQYISSDERLKYNIKPIRDALEKLLRLQGTRFVYKSGIHPNKDFNETEQIGFVADDVEKVFPEIVRTDKDGYKEVGYSFITAVLVEGIRELTERIIALENK